MLFTSENLDSAKYILLYILNILNALDCFIHIFAHLTKIVIYIYTLIIIRYDSDHNHSPCCKKGLKAHWAVISGFLILIEDDRDEDDDIIVVESSSNFSLCDCLEKNGKIDQNNIKFYSHNGKILISRKILDNFENLNNLRQGRIYLIGRQGKSKHIGLWPFVETAESNDNLLYFSTVRNSDEYVLPEGGPAEGLKGKAIILNASEKKK